MIHENLASFIRYVCDKRWLCRGYAYAQASLSTTVRAKICWPIYLFKLLYKLVYNNFVIVDETTKRQLLSCLFVCFDSLRPSQQFSGHFGTGLPGLNQH